MKSQHGGDFEVILGGSVGTHVSGKLLGGLADYKDASLELKQDGDNQ